MASKLKVTIVGSGNFGTTVARIVGSTVLENAEFDQDVRMWVFDELVDGESLVEIINRDHENRKYLPGVKLPENVRAVKSLEEACQGAGVLIFVLPHQFLGRLLPVIKPVMAPDAFGISLIKGIDFDSSGISLVSNVIREGLGIPVSVLMGANVASEIAKEEFAEATIGGPNGDILKKLFQREYFRINTVQDADAVELCGALKNIVALGAGFCDGLGFGNNTKSAIIRIGMIEMGRVIELHTNRFPLEILVESCGVADLITTCFGGRNRKCAEAFVRTKKTWDEIEQELLGGQKLQGTLTCIELHKILMAKGNIEECFPLFRNIYEIAFNAADPSSIVSGLVEEEHLLETQNLMSRLKRAWSSEHEKKPFKVTVVGSGNFGTTVAKIVAENAAARPERFTEDIRMWVYEEDIDGQKLTDIINTKHENVKYLPGITLPENVRAVPDLGDACKDADILIFVLPHQFLGRLIPTIKSVMAPGAFGVSLIKGFDADKNGIVLVSDIIREQLGIDVSVLMGANVASEIARGDFAEATIGGSVRHGESLKLLFQRPYFRISNVDKWAPVELCGALKNIVALGAGFCDGLGLGNNTKAAIIRIGMIEMGRVIESRTGSFPLDTLVESCGAADLITTCYGGRNRKCAEAFVRNQNSSWEDIEQELLGGQKLQGTLACVELHKELVREETLDSYPLFKKIHEIAFNGADPNILFTA
mmetsp:Transcript_19075/g.31243  ORF Transcript_19075/g.31243 Transcript_19075/m.31243 type:complete len:707 (+) Transcript_19075:131-2251(+)|eukprot:CAMPEP_0203744502 /NCGR_PEP_ID=MMETSP0098-20131031/542_1 /ASSEMBLY_ACC=CAM_ASM_000208 /TAXON_ID=96639 /ORGANISM=" , Strain NY0313808BC1" /LENGTH=706 /DNA_ID=CAMNT_0050632033 /DNA_START=96 /DNA_END=2216 /DNA_ORIENTATION=+